MTEDSFPPQSETFSGRFLLAIDLEDVRSMIPNGEDYAPRVPANTRLWLEFFERQGVKATFFVVGNVAKSHPELVREVSEAGHELACHSSNHEPLDRQTPASLREDLKSNRGILEDLGGKEVTGFRAPIFSLTENAAWCYDVLGELGFRYSSSVLPRAGTLYGWEGFPCQPSKQGPGLWELPVTLGPGPLTRIPFAGGIYFRLLPDPIVRWMFRKSINKNQPIVGYFHPYDVDVEQRRFQHPELGDSRILNALMYLGRRGLLDRVERCVEEGLTISRYDSFVRELESQAP